MRAAAAPVDQRKRAEMIKRLALGGLDPGKIAAHMNLHVKTVYNIIYDYGLKGLVPKAPNPRTVNREKKREKLRELYLAHPDWPRIKYAAEIGCAQSEIHLLCKQLGISTTRKYDDQGNLIIDQLK